MIACNAMNGTGQKIREMRERYGLTQEDLVAKSGRSLATIQRAERGGKMSADSLASIAAAFDVTVAELTDEVPEKSKPYLLLVPLTTGRQLVAMLRASTALDFGFCELEDLADARVIETFYDFCITLVGKEEALSPITLVTRELEAKGELAKLTEQGFKVGGATFDLTVSEVDEDDGIGIGFLYAQWEDTRVAIRVGRNADDITRAHVMDRLGKYEVPKGDAVIFPPMRDGDWSSFLSDLPNVGEE